MKKNTQHRVSSSLLMLLCTVMILTLCGCSEKLSDYIDNYDEVEQHIRALGLDDEIVYEGIDGYRDPIYDSALADFGNGICRVKVSHTTFTITCIRKQAVCIEYFDGYKTVAIPLIEELAYLENADDFSKETIENRNVIHYNLAYFALKKMAKDEEEVQ